MPKLNMMISGLKSSTEQALIKFIAYLHQQHYFKTTLPRIVLYLPTIHYY